MEYLTWLQYVVPEVEPRPLEEEEDSELLAGLSGLELLRRLSAAARPKAARRKRVKPLTEEEVELAEKSIWGEGNADEVLASRFSVDLSRRQMECLRPGEWLNDEVINFYFKLLQERTKAVKGMKQVWFANSFFWAKLAGPGAKEYNYKEVRRWTIKAKVDIFALDYVIFPMNIGETHWAMGAIDMKAKGFRYFDSMTDRPNKNFVPFLQKYVADEHKAKKSAPLATEDWDLIPMEPPVPQQRNGYDCGVFTCFFADFFSSGNALDFDQDDMPDLRQRLAARVVKADENWDA